MNIMDNVFIIKTEFESFIVISTIKVINVISKMNKVLVLIKKYNICYS